MKHYEARLERDLQEMRSRLGGQGDAVRRAVERAVEALCAYDRPSLYDVILRDHPINRETRAIDRLCHAFVARHLPAARPLRFVSSVLRLNIALERIGDYAVTISRVGVRMERPLTADMAGGIREMAEAACGMLESATTAFLRGDPELARATRSRATEVDRMHDGLLARLLDPEDGRSLRQVASLLSVLHSLERVSDQAKNICEETLFVTLGETKPPKVYRVLFVDARNTGASQLAEALARKAFPGSGSYASAGWAPGEAVDPHVLALADRLGLDLEEARPTALPDLGGTPPAFHVIVVLGSESPRLPEIPFHTVLLQWPVEEGAEPEELARDLSARIRDLMEILRGDTAC